MEDSILTKVVLPLALFIVMLGLGLSLTGADFRRAGKKPLPVIVGLVCQLALLPVMGFLVAEIFGLTGALAVGLVILSLCPGGVTSNMISYLARGDLALSITLTAISSVATPFTVPWLANLAFAHFGVDATEIALPIPKTMITLLAITIVPVGIGMFVRSKRESFAKRAERPVRILSTLFLALIIAGVVRQNWDELGGFFVQVGWAAFALNIGCMTLGTGLAFLLRLKRPQAITIGVEVGIQNGTTAIFITGTLLATPAMTIPPAVYSLIMFGTGAVFGVLMNAGRSKEPEPKPEEASSF
ncbi:MAG: bile acid:sodium symporter family protein [Myxococcota bacterium]